MRSIINTPDQRYLALISLHCNVFTINDQNAAKFTHITVLVGDTIVFREPGKHTPAFSECSHRRYVIAVPNLSEGRTVEIHIQRNLSGKFGRQIGRAHV